MKSSMQTPAVMPISVLIPAGEDRFGNTKILSPSNVAFKVTSQESQDIFVVEITLRQKGGPAKHVHFYQDEWFYILEGEFIIEAGDERMRLKPGESLFVPRKMPHVWAFVGETQGRMLAEVSPAGKLEEFFLNASITNVPPGPDQDLWRPYGMEWIGPPLTIE